MSTTHPPLIIWAPHGHEKITIYDELSIVDLLNVIALHSRQELVQPTGNIIKNINLDVMCLFENYQTTPLPMYLS